MAEEQRLPGAAGPPAAAEAADALCSPAGAQRTGVKRKADEQQVVAAWESARLRLSVSQLPMAQEQSKDEAGRKEGEEGSQQQAQQEQADRRHAAAAKAAAGGLDYPFKGSSPAKAKKAAVPTARPAAPAGHAARRASVGVAGAVAVVDHEAPQPCPAPKPPVPRQLGRAPGAAAPAAAVLAPPPLPRPPAKPAVPLAHTAAKAAAAGPNEGPDRRNSTTAVPAKRVAAAAEASPRPLAAAMAAAEPQTAKQVAAAAGQGKQPIGAANALGSAKAVVAEGAMRRPPGCAGQEVSRASPAAKAPIGRAAAQAAPPKPQAPGAKRPLAPPLPSPRPLLFPQQQQHVAKAVPRGLPLRQGGAAKQEAAAAAKPRTLPEAGVAFKPPTAAGTPPKKQAMPAHGRAGSTRGGSSSGHGSSVGHGSGSSDAALKALPSRPRAGAGAAATSTKPTPRAQASTLAVPSAASGGEAAQHASTPVAAPPTMQVC